MTLNAPLAPAKPHLDLNGGSSMNLKESWQSETAPDDVHKRSLFASLVGRGVPPEVASLAADAVHPYADLGNWAPDWKSRREVNRIALKVGSFIGQYEDSVPVEEMKGLTRWAFFEFARIAGPASRAGIAFEGAARAQALRSEDRSTSSEGPRPPVPSRRGFRPS
jgi:hypothetical protein